MNTQIADSPQRTADPFIVEGRSPGYAHERLWGTCPRDTSVKDVAVRWYHDYFGGRDAQVWTTSDGVTHWSCVRHTD